MKGESIEREEKGEGWLPFVVGKPRVKQEKKGRKKRENLSKRGLRKKKKNLSRGWLRENRKERRENL